MISIPEINFEEITGRDGNLGLITLTRQNVLNALNHAMFLALYNQLAEWENANHIKAVVIRAAEGRAFCAGGDIRSAYEQKKAGDTNLSLFFRDEYRMNQIIHQYSKPYIALLDGITMGGGVGISIHASHRVATDRLMFAMPETGIGFYPDVGTTYVLSRLPHYMGFYIGLTGARLSAQDCFAVTAVDELVKETAFPDIIFALADESFNSHPKETVTSVLQKFSLPAGESMLWQHRSVIEKCFAKKTVEEIIHALLDEKNDWCHATAAELKTKSPTSLKVTLRALQEAVNLDFEECMTIEYRLTCHFLESHEFFEGIRAAVIDKDRQPKWQPAKLEEVSMQSVKKFFDPLENEFV